LICSSLEYQKTLLMRGIFIAEALRTAEIAEMDFRFKIQCPQRFSAFQREKQPF
jgi:hypothetical protein